MTHINLLPWRELRRKEREREFYSIAVGAVVIMLLVMVYVHFHINGVIDTQNARNAFLGDEIKKVEEQIKKIRGLEDEKARLLARMKVIEELQGQRPQVVHLFDELVKAVPDGVYLTSLKQLGTGITIEGIAQSNARVSAFIRNVEASKWLAQPQLKVIQSLDDNKKGGEGQTGYTFILVVKEVIEGESLDSEQGSMSAVKAKPKSAVKPKATGQKALKAGKP